MPERIDLVHVEEKGLRQPLENFTSVPTISLPEAVKRFSDEPFAISGIVTEVFPDVKIPASKFISDACLEPLRFRKKLVLRDTTDNGLKFDVYSFGLFAENLSLRNVQIGDVLIIKYPQFVQKRFVLGDDPADTSSSQFGVNLGFHKGPESVKTEVIIVRKAPSKGIHSDIVTSDVSEEQNADVSRASRNSLHEEEQSLPPTSNVDPAQPSMSTGVRQPHTILNTFGNLSPKNPKPDRRYDELRQCNDKLQRYNTWGVISRISRAPGPTSGVNHMCIVYIRDQTYQGSFGFPDFQFNILGKRLEDFPNMSIGDVVRIHHMKIEYYNNYATGKVFDPNSVTVFPGVQGDPMRFSISATRTTFNEYDRLKVLELRSWWRVINQNSLDSQCQVTISEIGNHTPFDLACKVLEILDYKKEDKKILRVTDGTKCSLPRLAMKEHSHDDSNASLCRADAQGHTVDIFVKCDLSIIEKVVPESVVLLSGAKVVEETFSDTSRDLETTIYRIILPDDPSVSCRVLSPHHSIAKQVHRQIKNAGNNSMSDHDSELDNLLLNVSVADQTTKTTVNESTLNPFPNSQEFNQIINNADISALNGPTSRDQNPPPDNAAENFVVRENHTDDDDPIAKDDSMPVVPIFSANSDVIQFESHDDSATIDPGPSSATNLPSQRVAQPSVELTKSPAASQNSSVSQEYFTCCEEEPGNERLSPSPEPRDPCAITTETRYPWSSLAELNDCSTGDKRRVKGVVVRTGPEKLEPLQMVCGLCMRCSSVTSLSPEASDNAKTILSDQVRVTIPCKGCPDSAELVFLLGFRISETSDSNFATLEKYPMIYVSGMHAEKLLACSAGQFYTNKSLQKAVISKWKNLLNKPVEFAVLVMTLLDGSKELHLCQSVLHIDDSRHV